MVQEEEVNAREQGRRDQADNRAIFENPFPLYSDDSWKWKLGWYQQEMEDIETVLDHNNGHKVG